MKNREKQWREMIHFYNLAGNHIRTNEKLDADLRISYENDLWEFRGISLLMKTEILLKKNLSGPSEIENLEKQLSKN